MLGGKYPVFTWSHLDLDTKCVLQFWQIIIHRYIIVQLDYRPWSWYKVGGVRGKDQGAVIELYNNISVNNYVQESKHTLGIQVQMAPGEDRVFSSQHKNYMYLYVRTSRINYHQ